MKYSFLYCMVLAGLMNHASAQIYLTRNANINFHSKTPLENIDATNNQVYAVIDAAKKNLAFTMLLKGFLFERQLMQDHFNENYVESDKYPKASFNGSYTGDVDITKDGIYNVIAKGAFTLHNITKTIEVPATIEVKSKQLLAKANFKVTPEDYNINIPSLVRGKIDKQVTVNIVANCNFLK